MPGLQDARRGILQTQINRCTSNVTPSVRMTVVDMIEEAGFEILEAANADEAILLLEARRDITVSSPTSKCRVRWTASGSRRPLEADGRRSKSSRHLDVASSVTAICRPAGCSYQNPTTPARFPAHYGSSRPRPEQWPRKLPQKIRRPLETGSTLSSFWDAAIGGPGALRGPGGDGRRRWPTPARTILLDGGFGYENYLRFCSPLAVDHRL
jgi:hypothetical protein